MGFKLISMSMLWQVGKADFVGRSEAERFKNGIALTFAEQGKTIVYAKDDLGLPV